MSIAGYQAAEATVRQLLEREPCGGRILVDAGTLRVLMGRYDNLKAYADRTLMQHNCNDCGLLATCKYAPRLGESIRINCPLWHKERRRGERNAGYGV